MDPTIYRLVYLVLSTLLTLGVAWKMHRNGRLILADRFPTNSGSPAAINRALSIGMGILLLGWIIELNGPPNGFAADPGLLLTMAIERSGGLFLTLGSVYLLHLFLVSRFGSKPALAQGESNPA